MDRVGKCMKIWYGVALEHKEHALRGWNWGKGEFGKYELVFNVHNRPAFDIPFTEISNTNLAGKNEVSVELSLPTKEEDAAANGILGGARPRGKKAGGGQDQLVEMRFYIPGFAKKEDGDGSVDGDDDQEEHNAANLFYNTLVDKAEIGDVAGDTFATFQDVLHLTPRSVSPLRDADRGTTCLRQRAEVGLVSTCTRIPSGCAARRTTTRFNTTPSRSSWSFPNRTTCTI